MEITVTQGSEQYLLITDHALVTVDWRSADADRTAAMGAALGGMGVLLAELDSGAGLTLLDVDAGRPTPSFFELSDIHRCSAGNAPSELSSHRHWPRVAGDKAVAIFPRAIIRRVSLRWWGAFGISFTREYPEDNGGIHIWHVPRARRHLRSAGYPLA
jgi:hypothetical protein